MSEIVKIQPTGPDFYWLVRADTTSFATAPMPLAPCCPGGILFDFPLCCFTSVAVNEFASWVFPICSYTHIPGLFGFQLQRKRQLWCLFGLRGRFREIYLQGILDLVTVRLRHLFQFEFQPALGGTGQFRRGCPAGFDFRPLCVDGTAAVCGKGCDAAAEWCIGIPACKCISFAAGGFRSSTIPSYTIATTGSRCSMRPIRGVYDPPISGEWDDWKDKGLLYWWKRLVPAHLLQQQQNRFGAWRPGIKDRPDRRTQVLQMGFLLYTQNNQCIANRCPLFPKWDH